MSCQTKPSDSDASSLQPPASGLSLPIVSLAPSAEAEPASTERLPRWLKKQVPLGSGNQFTARLIEELRLETVCESAKCPNRMECWTPEDRHVHDPGQRLHAALRLLLGAQGQDRSAGSRRAGARGRSGRAAGPEARGDHFGHARRLARRRRRTFLSLRAGGAGADRRRGRSAHARLYRQARRDRTRRGGRAGGVQPQYRNGAAAVSRRCAAARATIAGRWNCCGA